MCANLTLFVHFKPIYICFPFPIQIGVFIYLMSDANLYYKLFGCAKYGCCSILNKPIVDCTQLKVFVSPGTQEITKEIIWNCTCLRFFSSHKTLNAHEGDRWVCLFFRSVQAMISIRLLIAFNYRNSHQKVNRYVMQASKYFAVLSNKSVQSRTEAKKMSCLCDFDS